jgi:hypothetical protein
VMAKRRKANADDAEGTKQSKRRDYEWINGTKEFPILTNGKLMDTPVFHPTEEEFSSFYAYAQKLDRWGSDGASLSFAAVHIIDPNLFIMSRLVGHIGVCKVVPPPGWRARADDVYTLEDSSERLDNECIVKRPIRYWTLIRIPDILANSFRADKTLLGGRDSTSTFTRRSGR